MTDRFTIRLVVAFLGLVALATVAGGFWLTAIDKKLPEALIAIGSGAVGAVAAVLARTSSDPPMPMQIVNPPDQSVLVAAPSDLAAIDDDGHTLSDEELKEIGTVQEEGAK